VVDALADEAWIEEKIAHRLAEVTDAVVRAAYAERVAAGEFGVPERYRAAHLFLTAHDPAKRDRRAEVAALDDELKRTASNQAAFAEAVKARSEDERTRSRGGDLGWFQAQRMPASFVQAVKEAPLGVLQGPVRTPLGWHWLWVMEKREARTAAFEEVRDELHAALLSQRRK
jgi:peptidylprolyl isomerase